MNMKNKLGTTAIVMLVVLAMLQVAAASVPEAGGMVAAMQMQNHPEPQNGLITHINTNHYQTASLPINHAFIWSKTTGMKDIGTLPGGNYSFAYGINDRGQVAGYSTNAAGYEHAVMWNKVGRTYVPTDLGTLPGDNYSLASGINNLGQVVGTSYNNATGYDPHAVLWNKVGMTYVPTDLGILHGGTFSWATGINSRGQIAGYGDNGMCVCALLWNKVGTIYVPTVLDYNWSGATAINSFGQVTGGESTNISEYEHAGLWNKVGMTYVLTELGTLPGGIYEAAYGINDRGQVVGVDQNATGSDHAVLWNKVGRTYVPTDLGTLSGSNNSGASGINNLGQVVGQSFNINATDYTFYDHHAVLWNKVGMTYVPTDLGTHSIASGINNLGQVAGGFFG